MQQITQELGSGKMEVHKLPYPQINDGMVIVKNYYSIISPGTEGSTVTTARKNLISKARDKPTHVKQVLSTLKNVGPIKTYRAVMNKLDAFSPLGYSCAGEVVEVGLGVTEFKVGDKVACAGAGYANHAEIVSVPKNLCVKLNDQANLADAAYNTLGAIAIQGVRQAGLHIGETCVVIGLGLIGQLASLILKASGIRVIGVDISEHAVKFSNSNNVCNFAYNRDMFGIEDEIYKLTRGFGADSVIITAATSSKDPINFAGQIARKKGTVVILGDVSTDFSRDPYWYEKELELKMSCSYGPGRYDSSYEEKGIDYPFAYVRWTENRNMQAFQELLLNKNIDISYLTTHEFDFEDALKAYDLIVDKSEPFIGIVLKYDFQKNQSKSKIDISPNPSKITDIHISFIGAGSYAQANLLPYLPKSKTVSRIGILANTGTTSKRVAEKFKFRFCTGDEDDLLNDETNLIFIATRHNSHSDFVLKALKNNKNVFVEKPLCLNEDELEKIIYAKAESNKSVMLGYNRRFSPLTKKIKKNINNGPMTIIYRVNAGHIPKDSWIQDPTIGGGRILGEVCHFIDYLTYINGSLPVNVSAQALPDKDNLNDTVNIMIQFANNSSAVICYYANGSKKLSKEYIEIFSSGTSIIMNDFKELQIYRNGKHSKTKSFIQNKGQKEMLREYIDSLLNNGNDCIPFEEIIAVSKTGFRIVESLKNNGKQFKIE